MKADTKKTQRKGSSAKQESWRVPVMVAGGVGVLLVAAIAGFLLWKTKHPSLPPSTAKPVDVAKFVASGGFDELKLSQKRDVLSKLPEGPGMGEALKSLSEEERHTVFEKSMKVREAERRKEIRSYFKLPPEQKEKWMAEYVAKEDKRRAEMREMFEKMRQQSGGKMPSGGPGGGPPDGGPPGGGGPPP